MAFHTDQTPDYLRGMRRLAVAALALALLGLFLFWRIDNPRVERFRADLIDKVAPTFEWTVKPAASLARLVADLRSYARVHDQNAELRRELQSMQGWREAALQLEQKNAELLALNNVRLSPRLAYVTAEVLADSGSPFRQSVLVNVGRADGVTDGAAVVDGLGLVGRVAGVGDRSARVLLLTDASSRAPVILRPSGQHAILAGDNRPAPALEFLDRADEVRPGDRVVSSGDGGLLPPEIPVGRTVLGADGRLRVTPSADARRLDFVRVLRAVPPSTVEGAGGLIGPRLDAAGGQP